MEIDALHPLVRIADAMENIAVNLEKLANPPLFSASTQINPSGFNLPGGVRYSNGKPPEMTGTFAQENIG